MYGNHLQSCVQIFESCGEWLKRLLHSVTFSPCENSLRAIVAVNYPHNLGKSGLLFLAQHLLGMPRLLILRGFDQGFFQGHPIVKKQPPSARQQTISIAYLI